jgi:large subunit ribosomal protein L24
MKKMKLKRNDPVIVVRGKRQDRGKTGKIKTILADKDRVVVEKVHIVKEYIRPNPQKNIQGGIVDRESSIPVASVMYYCRECEQGVRIGYKVIDDSKQRMCKKCETVLD